MTRKIMIVLVATVFACSSVFFLASCAKKQVKVEEEVTRPPDTSDEAARRLAELEAARKAEEQRLAREREMGMRQQLQREISRFESEHIYFDFDKSELKPEARAVLRDKAEWLRTNPQFSLRVEGHCDERGTNEYNLALGERRADAAWRFLNALGISGERLSSISYGEEQPADPRHNEDAWSKNRRDEFKLLR